MRSFPLGIRDRFRKEARAVEVDVRVEVIRAEIIDQADAVWRDMGRTQMFAHDSAGLGLRQCGIVGIRGRDVVNSTRNVSSSPATW